MLQPKVSPDVRQRPSLPGRTGRAVPARGAAKRRGGTRPPGQAISKSDAASGRDKEVAVQECRERPQRPLRQGQGILRRPGSRHKVVAHEAAEAFSPPHDKVGRADDGEVIIKNRYTTNQSQESTYLTMLRNECCVGYCKAGHFQSVRSARSS